jgi:hypothetical protein
MRKYALEVLALVPLLGMTPWRLAESLVFPVLQ